MILITSDLKLITMWLLAVLCRSIHCYDVKLTDRCTKSDQYQPITPINDQYLCKQQQQ